MVKVAILGIGTVGGGTAEVLTKTGSSSPAEPGRR